MSVAVGLTPDWKQWTGELVDGEFVLEEFLGSGKKSAVFRTRAISGNGAAPQRAIKLVQVRADDAKRLVDHWMRASGLEHPHLLKIQKAGTWSRGGASLAYLVTEHADENLGEVLEERTLTPEEAFEMLRPMASALAFLHGRKLVLGNLRAANIFAVDETLKVSSDGIAPGDPASDMRAFAATVAHVLTQKAELNGMETLPEPFREMVRNCVGASGQPAWSSADLVSWLRSPHGAAKASNAAVARAKAKPRITRYAIVTGIAFLALIVVGSLIKNRGASAQPAAVAQSAPATANPVAQTPAAVAPAKSAPAKSAPAKAAAVAPKKEPARAAAPVNPPRAEAASPTSTSAAQAVEQPLPQISDKARKTIHGTVVINVKTTVDETGVVTDATLLPTNSRYLGKLCAQAVRQWRFTPAAGGGTKMVRFVITQADTQASVR